MTPLEIVAEALHEQGDDMSDCPYRLTANNPEVPTESCNRGCYDEPQCETCVPASGKWPREELRERYEAFLPGGDEPFGPSDSQVVDAAAVLEALYASGWRLVRLAPAGGDTEQLYAVDEEWTPDGKPRARQ